jgi:hypothetical protein
MMFPLCSLGFNRKISDIFLTSFTDKLIYTAFHTYRTHLQLNFTATGGSDVRLINR